MNILVNGDQQRKEELKTLLANFSAVNIEDYQTGSSNKADLLIDLSFDDTDEKILQDYIALKIPVLLSIAKKQLIALKAFQDNPAAFNSIAGANFLPTFINRSLWELSTVGGESNAVCQVLEKIGIQFRLVKDRVAMVTPRVVCMIINEAYYTVQEGTASKTDIDLGMRLGTNYPKGPFDWCAQIGIKNVYQLLGAIYQDTAEERYKICPELKRKMLLEGA